MRIYFSDGSIWVDKAEIQEGNEKMKQDTSEVMKDSEAFQVRLIGRGVIVGIVGGLIVLAYRIALTYASAWLNEVIGWAEGNGLRMGLWFLCLTAMAVIIGKLVTYEPMISGSGIPQLEGEMAGKLEQTWWKVIPAKFLGGFLSLLGGLSLGREGPSIQLGAMSGKGIARVLQCGRTEEKFLMTCGASAGLSAAFHAPLAGVMFSLEEVHKNFSAAVLVSAMASSLTADLIAGSVIGIEPVFQFDIGNVLPHSYYWLLIPLGMILGAMGVFYNWFTLMMQKLYQKLKKIPVWGKLLIPLAAAWILAFTMPELLGSGHNLIIGLTSHQYTLGALLFLFLLKFLFAGLSFGSGAPGGIFFPLLVLGSLIGGIFGMTGVSCFGMDLDYVNNFVLLSMAGYFTAIVRAPLTGIILIFEMTGSLSQLLSLSIISIIAYVTASLLKSAPIYESLLERLLQKRGEEPEEDERGKILQEQVIMLGSELENRRIREITWPKHCLLVAVKRGERELLPHGDTLLKASDMIVILTNEKNEAEVHDYLEQLCREKLHSEGERG